MATPEEGVEPEPEATVERPKQADEEAPAAAALRPGDFVSYQGKLFGTLQEYMVDRERWALQLADGRVCAAKAEQLERTPFEPFARVEVVGADCGPLAGMCGEITGFLPERGRWTLKLDVGRDAAARTDQLRLTDKPKPEEGDDAGHSCSCGGADTQPNGAHPENCLDSGDAPQLPGLSETDQALVSLVAKDGAAEKDWDKKSFQLHAAAIESRAATTTAGKEVPEELETRTGAELAARWAEIAPVRLGSSRIHIICLHKPLREVPDSCVFTLLGSHALAFAILAAARAASCYESRNALWTHLCRVSNQINLPSTRRY
eukprot:COSAG02_NODE_160_length_32694_cov_18.496947_18_plen_318_part_00